jgi:3-phosphoshikimate 1-carboxyvinyltransferase
MIFKPLKKIALSPYLPGDKSLSHRALIFSALAGGVSEFKNLSLAQDVLSTKKVLSHLGVEIVDKKISVLVHGTNKKLKASKEVLDCGNAGTLMRLMMGVLAGQEFSSVLVGDESLSQRPMKRVQQPLEKTGAKMTLKNGNFAPIEIAPARIHGAQIDLAVSSAQVKSALLLAGLFSESSETVLTGKIHSRDHTERFLKYFGAEVAVSREKIILKPNAQLKSKNYFVPNDISAASFWITAGLLAEDGDVILEDVGLNPTRLGFVNVLKNAGAAIDVFVEQAEPEPIGRICVSSSSLKPFHIKAEEVASLVDEIPLLALIATQIDGESTISGAEELRFKESDRLLSTQSAVRDLGGQIEIHGDDLKIRGKQKLKGGFVKTFKDHRIAMMAATARFCCSEEVHLDDALSAEISDPYFIQQMGEL